MRDSYADTAGLSNGSRGLFFCEESMGADVSAGLTVLSAMITPAVLLSACASLIIATTSRLQRAVDRTREVSKRFTDLAAIPDESGATIAEQRMLFAQIDYSTTRSRLLQRALAGLYYSVGAYVATSVAIAVAALSDRGFVFPIALGIGGSGLLLYASLVLVHESRVALNGLTAEMDFVWAQSRATAPSDFLEPVPNARWALRRRAPVMSA